ncbi:uncharacterized protein EV420DRAFT_1720560 [Desarmillaria tabescens]|uniref:Uncharacterized protein n=1 Tax=Armillaria tabescens TaxID=1929756 RepID=A0AA39JMC6_ARMTA|nr:uncharacterized protein EV420DRAFT_1720560 [Desarmillaria tabescens]KAK0445298.1 hypothetical protein EV420DRAFT_1720560 [Desarmillaria tabescens]
MNASRPPPTTRAPSGNIGKPPFRDMADRRNARREQNISAGFDPAMEASKKKFAETLGHPTKKKKIGTKTDSGASATSATASSKPADVKEEWNVGLVEDTDAVYQEKYPKPDRDKVMALYQQRYIRNVMLSRSASDFDIRQSINAVFADLQPQSLDSYGEFTVLIAIGAGQGSKSYLVPLRLLHENMLTIGDLDMAKNNAKPRNMLSDTLKKLFYIALPCGAPNLRLKVMSRKRKQSSDVDMDSQEDYEGEDEGQTVHGDDSPSVASENVNNGAAQNSDTFQRYTDDSGNVCEPDPSQPSSSRMSNDGSGTTQDHTMHEEQSTDEYIFNTFTNETSDDEPPFSPSEELFSCLPPGDYLVVTRLVTFMARPTPDQNWWAPSAKKVHPTFQNFTPEATGLTAFLRAIRAAGPHVFPPSSVATFLDQAWEKSALSAVFPRLANLTMWTVVDEEEFDAIFALGPGGLLILTEFLASVYDIFCKELLDCQEPSVIAVRKKYYESATVLLTLVRKVRSKYHRSLWDPASGFRELAVLLHKNSHQLPVGDPNDRMYRELQKINMSTMTVDHVKFHLRDAFHSATDPTDMFEDVVRGGPFGLDGFYSSYVQYVLDVMPTSDPRFNSMHDLLLATSKALGRKVANYLKKPSSRRNEDDMTNSDSLASDWYDDVKETTDDIKTRRSRRHPVSVHDSDSEPDKTDSSRTNTKASSSESSKRHPDPPPSSKPKPKPRPRPIPVESARVRAARKLVDENLPLEALMNRLLCDWPHPKPEKRPKMDNWSVLSLKKKAQRLQLVYHSDKNVNETEEWKKISAALVTAINVAIESARL